METQHLHFRDRAVRRVAVYELTSFSRTLTAYVTNNDSLGVDVLAMPARGQDWVATVPDISLLRSSGIHRFDVIRATRNVGDYHSRLKRPGPLREVSGGRQPLMLRHTIGWAMSEFAKNDEGVSRRISSFFLLQSARAPVVALSDEARHHDSRVAAPPNVASIVTGLAGKLSTVLWAMDPGNVERTMAISLLSDTALIMMASKELPGLMQPISQELVEWSLGRTDPSLIHKRGQILADGLNLHMKELAGKLSPEFSIRDSSWEAAMAYQAHRDLVMAKPMAPVANLAVGASLKDRALIGSQLVRLSPDDPMPRFDKNQEVSGGETQLIMDFPV